MLSLTNFVKRKPFKNAGFRDIFHSHSIVAVLQALMQQWFARGKSVFTTSFQHLWFISVCLTILKCFLYQQFSIFVVVKFTTKLKALNKTEQINMLRKRQLNYQSPKAMTDRLKKSSRLTMRPNTNKLPTQISLA